jgi:predicted TIM-barrel fold metal-dependent hydrolase
VAVIVDSHAYCFPPADHPAGHPSGAAHLRWVQAAHAGHHQPAWKVRDRAPANSRVLCPGTRYVKSELPDVQFRVDREKGRVAWTIDGEDYTKQFYPPNLHDMELTPHGLIGEMDYAGVDVALLHTNPFLSRDAAYQAECVRLYPDRLRSMAPADEWRIIDEPDAVVEEVRAAVAGQRLHAIKFNARLAYLDGTQPWDDGPYRSFWEAAVALGVPIFFTLGAGTAELSGRMSVAELRSGYLDEQRVLMRWMERYPQAVCSLTHGFPWRAFLEGDRIVVPDEIWRPFENPRCHLEVCFPVRIGDLFDFPYREVWPTLEAVVERVGPDQLMWGTDMPFQNRFCTYRQSRVWIEKYCAFLDRESLAKIMGGTAARVLGL